MLIITCPSEKFFRNLCQALERNWVEDPRFRNIELRLQHEDDLDEAIGTRCKDFGRDELLERLVAADVLAAPINEIPEVVEDPQINHNEMIVTAEHQKLGTIKVTGVPIHLHGTPGSVRLAPPVQGQHTVELLGELGYGDGEIDDLVRDGAAMTPAELSRSRT
jgi:crotonobetainyl-CoA:carnitine CoA-transferase CaiB-like acyl-CoA transferase